MSKSTVSFEQLDREHRRERADDALRLRAGRTTPEDLQRENSLFPENTRVRVRDLVGYARRNYLRK